MSISPVSMLLGALGLLVAWDIYRKVLAYSAGESKVVGIADKIHRGAMVFMRTEYTYLAVFVVGAAASRISCGIFSCSISASNFLSLCKISCKGAPGASPPPVQSGRPVW